MYISNMSYLSIIVMFLFFKNRLKQYCNWTWYIIYILSSFEGRCLQTIAAQHGLGASQAQAHYPHPGGGRCRGRVRAHRGAGAGGTGRSGRSCGGGTGSCGQSSQATPTFEGGRIKIWGRETMGHDWCPHGPHHPTMNGIWSMPWLLF